MAQPERPATPMWWYLLVGLAIAFAALWLIQAIIGLAVAIVKLAIVVILAIAIVSWVLQSKADR